jgi:hypothetical protein
MDVSRHDPDDAVGTTITDGDPWRVAAGVRSSSTSTGTNPITLCKCGPLPDKSLCAFDPRTRR